MRKTGCVALVLAMCLGLLTGCKGSNSASASSSSSVTPEVESSEVQAEVESETEAEASYDVEAVMGESDSSITVEDPVMDLDYKVYTTQLGVIVMTTNSSEQTWYNIKITVTLEDENGESIGSYNDTIAALQPGETLPAIIRISESIEYDNLSVFAYSDSLKSTSTVVSSYVTATHSVAQDGTLDVTITSSYNDFIDYVTVIVIFTEDGSPVGFDYYYTYLAAEDSSDLWFEGPSDSDGNYIEFDDAEVFILATCD